MSSAFFDGEISLSFAVLPFLNSLLYYASGTVSPGFHFFYADGLYIIFITGRTNNSAYGFIPAFNSKSLLLRLINVSVIAVIIAMITKDEKFDLYFTILLFVSLIPNDSNNFICRSESCQDEFSYK